LNAAEELFVAHGFSGASVTDITELAGTSVGTLYYHFGSKNGVYKELWQRYIRTQRTRTREAVTLLREAGVTDGRRLFLAGTRAYLTSSWEHRGIVRLVSDGDAPPSFAVVTRRVTLEWAYENSKLLPKDDPLAARALRSILTSSIGGIAREVADCLAWHEADQLIGKAIEVYAELLGISREGDVVSRTEPGAVEPGAVV
jgi:AcrR family transcriptional regulator